MSTYKGYEQMRSGETLQDMFDRLEGKKSIVKHRRFPKFESRMMRLKGIKLPSRGVQDVDHTTSNRQPKVIVNPLVGQFGLGSEEPRLNDLEDEQPLDLSNELDDILVSAVRSIPVHSTHTGYGICKSTLVSILDRLKEVSVTSIIENYGFGERHARRYVQAVSLVVVMVKRQNIMTTWADIIVNAD